MKRIAGYFFEGLLLFVPVVTCGYVFFSVFRWVDRMLGIDIPGVGFGITLVFILVLGFLISTVIAKTAIHLFERFLSRFPMLKVLYTSVKDLVGAVLGRKGGFDRPVLVAGPDGGAKILGFVTRDDLSFLGLKDHVAVYVPQSYNFTGSVFVYPSSAVEPIDATSEELLAFIISGGVAGPAAAEAKG